MEITKQNLLKALQLLSIGFSSKEIFDQSDKIIFDDDYLRSYNDEFAVLVPFKTGISGAVPAKELKQYINKYNSKNFELIVKDNMLYIKGKKGKAGIIFESEIRLPFDNVSIGEKWHKLPEDFVDDLQLLKYSVSTDYAYPILTFISVNEDTAVSCDNRRVTKINLSSSVAEPMLIPATVVAELKNHQPCKYNVKDGWLHFKNKDNVVLSCRTTQLEYPDVDQFFEAEGIEIDLPRNIGEILDEVSVFAESEISNNSRITVKLEDNLMTVSSKSDKGFAEHSKKIRYKGESITFSINADYFKDAIQLGSRIIVTERSLLMTTDRMQHLTTFIKGN